MAISDTYLAIAVESERKGDDCTADRWFSRALVLEQGEQASIKFASGVRDSETVGVLFEVNRKLRS